MRIASWNVNSIRARADHVEKWLAQANPDVLCLQETKVADDGFPLESFSRLGYEVAFAGQRTYNGVAIAARHPLCDVSVGLDGAEDGDDKRLIAATVRGVRVLSAYVPNGKTPDSPSFGHKLAWLARLRATLDARYDKTIPLALCGDFNVARDVRDVFDAERMQGQLHFTEQEHQSLNEILAFGLVDSLRKKTDEPELYSWWDYRMGAYRRNRGLRIDYIFVTKPLSDALTDAYIDREPRGWPKPSDHAPVVLDADLQSLPS